MVLTGAAAPIPLRSLTPILPGQTRLRTANRPAQVLIASDRELNSAVFQQPARPATLVPIRHRPGSQHPSHSPTGRWREIRQPWRNPRPYRAAEAQPLGSILIALSTAGSDHRHDPSGG